VDCKHSAVKLRNLFKGLLEVVVLTALDDTGDGESLGTVVLEQVYRKKKK